MKNISKISRILGACVLVIGAFCLLGTPSDWILILIAAATAVLVFFSVFFSKKQKISKNNI